MVNVNPDVIIHQKEVKSCSCENQKQLTWFRFPNSSAWQWRKDQGYGAPAMGHGQRNSIIGYLTPKALDRKSEVQVWVE